MKKLLPTDKKAIAIAAWLFYTERGFHAELSHALDDESIMLKVYYEDTQELPNCPLLAHPTFCSQVVRVDWSEKIYTCTIPEVFI